MPLPMLQAHLDALVAGGCVNPACRHAHHTHDFFVTGLCHLGAGLRVEVLDKAATVLQTRCWKCQMVVSQIRMATRLEIIRPCTHTRGWDVHYRAGVLTVACRRCGGVAGVGDVATDEPTEAPDA